MNLTWGDTVTQHGYYISMQLNKEDFLSFSFFDG